MVWSGSRARGIRAGSIGTNDGDDMTVSVAVSVTGRQALPYRVARHNLTRRLAAGALCEAAGACGIRNTPPGSAALAFHARVARLTPADLDRALAVDKTLVQLWRVRGAPYIVSTRDAAPFSVGLLPDDEESMRAFVNG